MGSRSRSRQGGRGDRLRVAVLMGGPSSEHEVSLLGGRNVVDALDLARFEVRPVVISREGTWWMPGKSLAAGNGHPAFDPHRLDGWKREVDALDALAALRDWGVDVVVPILHGRYGEDGTIQACLQAAGIRFVGSGAAASAVAIDKVRTKEVLAYHGLSTPAFEELRADELRRGVARTAERLVATYGTPIVAKDPEGGSSLEVRIADDAGALAHAIGELVPPARRLMIEQYVAGRELTAGVVHDRDRGEPMALPVVEIRPRKSRSFDYREKYSADGAEELCPAPIPPEVEAQARAIGLRVHRLLGLSGISRTDLILDHEGRLQVLEVNTIPGMTATSLVPRAARVHGLAFPQLVEALIRTAGEGERP